MNTRHLIDAETVAIIEALPVTEVSRENLAALRALGEQATLVAQAQTAYYPQLEVSERHCPGPAGAPDVRVLTYRPRAASKVPLAGLLWIHGGGYVGGSPEGDDAMVKAMAAGLDSCLIVSVDYRLAPEHPHPAPIEDCYAALRWLHAQAGEFGVDPARIGIAGQSAGGGLCASLALLARDRGEVPLCLQAPMQPMIDDRTCTREPHPTAGEFIWTRKSNHFGWSALLGHEPGDADVSPYAAAARSEDLRDLPPTFIGVGSLDLFLDEDTVYAQRLVAAGVPAELHVYPGGVHAFHLLAPQAAISKAYERDFLQALRRGLGIDKAEPAKPVDLSGLTAQLQMLLPGIPAHDLPRFARSAAGAEPYGPGPDSRSRDGVPRGEIRSGQCSAGDLYPGVPHDYKVYVPVAYDASRPAALIVFQDGGRYLGPEANAATVLDNLIADGSIPPTIAVFIEPGAQGPGLPIYGGPGNRSVEYDSAGDAYARFLIDELLPAATLDLSVSTDPSLRTIIGLSSGGHCAFNAAWERPDAFGKVISHCGSFVDLRGGHELARKVRGSERKALKVFLQTGERDLDIAFGHWLSANQQMAAALAYRGYEHQLVIGSGGHSLAHGGALLPDTLRWLFAPASDQGKT